MGKIFYNKYIFIIHQLNQKIKSRIIIKLLQNKIYHLTYTDYSDKGYEKLILKQNYIF